VDDNAWTPWGRVQVAAAALGDDASLLGLSVLIRAGASVPVTASNYDKFPIVAVPGHDDDCVAGWDAVAARLKQATAQSSSRHVVLVVENVSGRA
jgi:hypothetical protein